MYFCDNYYNYYPFEIQFDVLNAVLLRDTKLVSTRKLTKICYIMIDKTLILETKFSNIRIYCREKNEI